MKELFSNSDPAADAWYRATARPEHRGSQRSRQNCDDLWPDFEPLASSHFLAEFPYRFHQRWFEMYLTVARGFGTCCCMTRWLAQAKPAKKSRPPSFSNVVGPIQEDQVVAGLLRDSVMLCCALG
jgi:hypothetical protein